MGETLNEIMQEYNQLLDMQVFNQSELDYGILDYHLPLLRSIDVVDSGCISVFDLNKRNHVYYSPKYETLLGWDAKRAEKDLAYTNSLIHPDDLPMIFKAAICYVTLGFALPDKTESRFYKSVFDYRVKGKQGSWVRIIEQQVPLEFDKSGNIWLALSMVDLSPDTDVQAPFRGWLKYQRTGELFKFPPAEDAKRLATTLTTRETEILKLIAGGLISKEIADRLFISVNTVNTHRQRIIEKLNVSNTYEAIRYGHERGLF